MPTVVYALIAATAIAFAQPTDAPSPSPGTAQPAAASPAPPIRPLREVVYDVTTNWRVDDITESYAGGANAVEPGSTNFMVGDGTLTVDVIGKRDDGSLIVIVTEVWKALARPLPFTGDVSANGLLAFDSTGPAALDDVAGELLPYFGTRFAPDGTLDTTTRWSLRSASGKISVSTDYGITAVSGDTVTIHKAQSIKGIGDVLVDGSVVYEPSLLAPVSGHIQKRSTEMYPDGQQTRTLEITFSEVSDSFAPRKQP